MRRTLLILLLTALGLAAVPPRPSASEEVHVVAYVDDSVDAVAALAVMTEAYRRIGVDVEFRAFPAAEALEASSNGQTGAELQRIDGITRRFKTLVQVPVPINYLQGMAFSNKYTFPVQGWISLKPYRVGIVKGILFAERGTEGFDVAVAENYLQLVQWIVDDKVDVGIMPRISGLHAIQASGEDIHPLDGVLETLLLYHYVHESNAPLVPKLAPVLKEMLLDGTTQRMRKDTYDKLLWRGS
mgnify:CR=1 FL=1